VGPTEVGQAYWGEENFLETVQEIFLVVLVKTLLWQEYVGIIWAQDRKHYYGGLWKEIIGDIEVGGFH